MGIGPKISDCLHTSQVVYVPEPRPAAKAPKVVYKSQPDPRNPDPACFNITDVSVRGNYLACVVVYPNCTNYEGKKILVLKCSPQKLYALKMLDPHFCDHDHISPIARFEPTDKGWNLALKLLDILASE